MKSCCTCTKLFLKTASGAPPEIKQISTELYLLMGQNLLPQPGSNGSQWFSESSTALGSHLNNL